MDEDVLRKLRRAGRIASEARDYGVGLMHDGAPVLEVCDRIEDRIRERGAKPAFPTCLSIDHVAAHYTPTHADPLALRRGNVVKLDMGAQIDGYIADTAVTVEVGTRNWDDLIRASEHALQTAIEAVRPKVATRLIGAAVERTIESYGYRPISNLTGHTIDRYVLHAGKSVPNVGDHGHDVLEEGDVLAIEPFATDGAGKVNGAKTGNIYRVLSARGVKPEATSAFLRRCREAFSTLPFAERWCYALDRKAPSHLSRLVRMGVVKTYPALLDAGRGTVSQTEHTMIIHEDGPEVTTG